MATLFKRIKHLQLLKKIGEVSKEQRAEFGIYVYNRVISIDNHPYVDRCESKEPEGVFIVRSYPKVLIPLIDKMIIDKFGVKPKRKRMIKTFHNG